MTRSSRLEPGLGFNLTIDERRHSISALVMNKIQIRVLQFALGASLIGWAWAGQPAKTRPRDVTVEPSAKQGAEQDVFGLSKVYKLHLTISAKEWEAMQPADPGGFRGFPGPLPNREHSAEKTSPGDHPTHRGGMMEYPIVHGDLAEDGRIYKNVAIRYKGNFTYMVSAHLLKRSLKLEFDQGDKNAPGFHGLGKINLHAGVLDPTRQREALSYAVFNAARVPAPRTAFAELTLTVPGHYDREYLGLYTLVEQVDGRFLMDRFGTGKGLLLKPQGVRGPEYLGDTWADYAERYRPARDPSPDEAKRVIAFANLVSNGADERFEREIDSYLDVDEFLRFLAATALLVNLDSPLAMPQNFYVYLDPKTNRFLFLPWDLDLSLAAWPMGGPPEQQMDLSLAHPHVGEHKLIDRLLALPAIKERYQTILKDLAASAFSKERLLAEIETIETTTNEALAKEAKAVAARHESGDGFAFIAAQAPLPRVFVEKRTQSIQAQLAGERQGYTPTMAFGGPGGPRGPGGDGRPPGPPGPPGPQPFSPVR
jgi:spore coat protein CotH